MKLFLIFLILALPVGEGFAYVPTMTCNPSGLFRCGPNEIPKQVKWKERCISYYLHEAGSADIPTDDMGRLSAEFETAIIDSFDAWHNISCNDLQLLYGGQTDDFRQSADGKANILVWRDETWPEGYSRTAYALTSVTYNAETGYLVDADIEMNGQFHTFTLGDQNVQIDIQNTITHEAGHFIGLDHSLDIQATMFASAAVGETKKRSLEQDDIDGMCFIYPIQEGGRSCEPPPPHSISDDQKDDGCCATAPTRPSDVPLALIIALGSIVLLRRR